MWIAPIATVLGVVLGALLAFLFGSVRGHAAWVNDQKRLEYRQLIDQLFETMTVVVEGRPNLRDQNLPAINKAVRDLHRVLLDRIFIAEKLQEAKILDDFLEMKKVIFYEPELQAVTPRELRYTTFNVMQRENNLREKILELAKADLAKLNVFGIPVDE
jgi:hypothetical protein